MTLPVLPAWTEIYNKLPIIFPPGLENREHSIWEIAAKTIFVMMYVGAVEGRDFWLRPDQVTKMTDLQAAATGENERLEWIRVSLRPGRTDVPGRWYAVNSRESIRDDTIRYSLIENAAVIERPGLKTTSPSPRYALQKDFAALLDPSLDEPTFLAKAEEWRAKHLNKGALARLALHRAGTVNTGSNVLVTFPNGETRSMVPGESSAISKAVIEVFAATFLQQPGVVFLSESGNKVVARDDKLAKRIGLNIPADRSLPDIILVDLGPAHPLLVFVEVVWSDGPVNEARKRSLLQIAQKAGFDSKHVAFVTAFYDRSSAPFKKTVNNLAWGSYAWFVTEPDRLILFSDKAIPIEGS